MLFLVVGTPWKRPRSSRLCCLDCGDGWFGGISSTRTATLRMRLRNSCGSESSTSSTTLTKCSRFILHPMKWHAHSEFLFSCAFLESVCAGATSLDHGVWWIWVITHVLELVHLKSSTSIMSWESCECIYSATHGIKELQRGPRRGVWVDEVYAFLPHGPVEVRNCLPNYRILLPTLHGHPP